MKAAANKLLPWCVGLVYLALIASLGRSFQSIEQYGVEQILEQRDGQSNTTQLGLVRVTDEYPQAAIFSLRFSAPPSEGRWAAFLPRSSSDLQLSVNKFPLQLERVSFHRRGEYQPLLIPIPAQVLDANGFNELTIKLQANSPAMVLSKFYLGPQSRLEPVHRMFSFFRQDLLHGAFAATGLLAVFLGTVWLVRRQFLEYGLLAAAFLAFSYYLILYVRTSEPHHPELFMWSVLLARAIFVWAFMVFVHVFIQRRRRWLEYLVAVFFSVVFAIGLALISADRYVDFMNLTYVTSLPMVLLVITYMSVVLMIALLRSGHVYLHWLLAGGLLGLLLGIHDVLVLFDVSHWLIRDFYISHYAIVFTTVGYGGVLVHRIAQALFNSEDLNIQLSARLHEKTAALEQAAKQKIKTERQLALAAERQRIMADMHDGVGGQLVSLIAANRSGRLDQTTLGGELDQVLADLRLLLDALSPAGEELISSLARLRERYTPLLGSAGVDLDWSIDPALDDIALQPSQVVNVLRVVQEAIQNVVKHAEAQQIRLSLETVDGGYLLSISDDGNGLSSDRVAGHGTDTLQQRAMALGGSVEMVPSESGGTRVNLSFPYPSPTTP